MELPRLCRRPLLPAVLRGARQHRAVVRRAVLHARIRKFVPAPGQRAVPLHPQRVPAAPLAALLLDVLGAGAPFPTAVGRPHRGCRGAHGGAVRLGRRPGQPGVRHAHGHHRPAAARPVPVHGGGGGLATSSGSTAFIQVVDYIDSHLDKELPIPELAALVKMGRKRVLGGLPPRLRGAAEAVPDAAPGGARQAGVATHKAAHQGDRRPGWATTTNFSSTASSRNTPG